ncbi:Hypothetical protein, putative [Bodo saltans]|uniref:Uncharacterized protein n=1 Tax=Bodo saltans TaxID=75058 RepID=A0A0S4IYQ7_BODSA|nr:Hypothetical protein, putative [Bodo saltans]|eukprot:CUG20728.1 Hypothetical protein, putative [Bodo saltans]
MSKVVDLDDLEKDAIDDALFWSVDDLGLVPQQQMKGSDDFEWMMPCDGAHAEDATSVSSVLDDASLLIVATAQIDFGRHGCIYVVDFGPTFLFRFREC